MRIASKVLVGAAIASLFGLGAVVAAGASDEIEPTASTAPIVDSSGPCDEFELASDPACIGAGALEDNGITEEKDAKRHKKADRDDSDSSETQDAASVSNDDLDDGDVDDVDDGEVDDIDDGDADDVDDDSEDDDDDSEVDDDDGAEDDDDDEAEDDDD